MTLSEAQELINLFENKATRKSELSLFKLFHTVLSNLQGRNFDQEQLNAIETQLDKLKPGPEVSNTRKHFRKVYYSFITFLRKEFQLVTPNHYTNTLMIFGMTFGSGIGLAIGTALKAGTGTAIGMSLGTGVGMVMGISMGAAKDATAKKEGRVLA